MHCTPNVNKSQVIEAFPHRTSTSVPSASSWSVHILVNHGRFKTCLIILTNLRLRSTVLRTYLLEGFAARLKKNLNLSYIQSDQALARGILQTLLDDQGLRPE
jgi:hypothetical protein